MGREQRQTRRTRLYGYGRVLGYARAQWRRLVLLLALSLSTSALAALQPWPMKILLDYALGAAVLPAWLEGGLAHLAPGWARAAVLVVISAAASLGAYALGTAVKLGTTRLWSAAGQSMSYALAADMFHRLEHLSPSCHRRWAAGDLMCRLTEDTFCGYTVVQAVLVAPFQHLFGLLTVGMVAWQLDPDLALLMFAVAPATMLSAVLFAPLLERQAKNDSEARARLVSFVQQTLASVPLVQAFGTGSRNGFVFGRLANDAVATAQRRPLVQGGYKLVSGLGAAVGTGLVLYVGGGRVLAGTLTLGSLLVFLAYVSSMAASLQGLLSIMGQLKTANAHLKRVLEVLDADEQVRDQPGAQPLPGGRARGHVRLEGVCFGYEPNRPVLHDITLEARPGELVALVGPTGAGKSTLISLVPRLFEPWAGRVTLDGYDLRALTVASVRAQVALVLQEPYLLPLSVAENIAYGRPQATRAQIEAAAQAACADEFIRRLPAGYDTVLGERGASLSGGEKQRLAIARALLMDAPILVLDEPTAALDQATEAELWLALSRLMAGRTTFVIAHRLRTVERADRIAVLWDGRLVEQGRHEELLAARGFYYRLHGLPETAVEESKP